MEEEERGNREKGRQREAKRKREIGNKEKGRQRERQGRGREKIYVIKIVAD